MYGMSDVLKIKASVIPNIPKLSVFKSELKAKVNGDGLKAKGTDTLLTTSNNSKITKAIAPNLSCRNKEGLPMLLNTISQLPTYRSSRPVSVTISALNRGMKHSIIKAAFTCGGRPMANKKAVDAAISSIP